MLGRLWPLAGWGKTCEWLRSTDEMQAILERERLRSDRSQSRFALLTLTFQTPCAKLDLSALSRIFRDRTRATDDAGLLGPFQLGVVLPETSAAGAWKLADDLCTLLPADIVRPVCEVYEYPAQPSRGELVDAAVNGHSRNGHDTNGHDTNGHDTNGHASNGHGQNGKRREERRKAQPMHTLFVRPLPAWKRALDIAGASVLLVLASPVMLVATLAIKLTSPGPIVFKQQRDTIGGRRFMIYKFRTMCVDAEAKKAALRELSEQDGPAFKIAKDPRITPIGGFLRVTSIDELPQLFNVLAGDMTLVGPRAMDSKESECCESWQRRRLDVTAGLTCIWQVRGRSAVTFAEWMRMDLCYIRQRSLLQDLKLIFATVPAVLLRRGAC